MSKNAILGSFVQKALYEMSACHVMSSVKRIEGIIILTLREDGCYGVARAEVAQLAEHSPEKAGVDSSILSLGTIELSSYAMIRHYRTEMFPTIRPHLRHRIFRLPLL
jgi:hypothetical protein